MNKTLSQLPEATHAEGDVIAVRQGELLRSLWLTDLKTVYAVKQDGYYWDYQNHVWLKDITTDCLVDRKPEPYSPYKSEVLTFKLLPVAL